MSEPVVVDASVVVKWFNRGEAYEKEAIVLRNAWGRAAIVLYAPELLQFEVANAIWKNPKIDEPGARMMARLAIRLTPFPMGLTENLAEESMQMARTTNLTYYDTVYITLARSAGYPFITADAQQLAVAKRYARALHIAEVGRITEG